MNVKFGVEESMQKWEYEIPETVNVTNFTNLFHLRTRTAYVYNGRLVCYHVVLTPRIRSSVKYYTVNWGKMLTLVTSAINQHAHCTWTRNRHDKRQEINSWLYCTLEWYVELTIRHTTPDIRCTQLYSLTMTTKAAFSHLPTRYCFHCRPCTCNALCLYVSSVR